MNEENALIYGATGGLGRAILSELSKAGVNIFLIGRSKSKLKSLIDEFGLLSSNMFCIPNITGEKELKKAQQWLSGLGISFRYGIHSAGTGIMKPVSKIKLAEWNEVIDINLTSAFTFYKLFSQVHREQEYELVFFSSASLNQAWPKNSLYGASKAGLEAFTQSLQKEIKSEGGRVWLYRAGSINTGFFDRVKTHLPFNKMLSPDDVAKLVVSNFKTPQGIYLPMIPILSE